MFWRWQNFLSLTWGTNIKLGIDVWKFPSFIHFQIVSLQVAHMPRGWCFFPFVIVLTRHMFLCNYFSLHSRNKCWYHFFHYFWRLYSCQNVSMINSTCDTSTLRTWLVNHTLHLSSTVHYVCGTDFVAPYCSQILLHIRNIHFWCHIISNYSLGNTPFFIDFDQTVTTDPTLRRLDCIN